MTYQFLLAPFSKGGRGWGWGSCVICFFLLHSILFLLLHRVPIQLILLDSLIH